MTLDPDRLRKLEEWDDFKAAVETLPDADLERLYTSIRAESDATYRLVKRVEWAIDKRRLEQFEAKERSKP